MSETTTLEQLQNQAANRDQHEIKLADLAFRELIVECANQGIPSDLDRIEQIIVDAHKTWDDLSGEIAERKEVQRIESLAPFAEEYAKKRMELHDVYQDLCKQRKDTLESAIKQAEKTVGDKYDTKVTDAYKAYCDKDKQSEEADEAVHAIEHREICAQARKERIARDEMMRGLSLPEINNAGALVS